MRSGGILRGPQICGEADVVSRAELLQDCGLALVELFGKKVSEECGARNLITWLKMGHEFDESWTINHTEGLIVQCHHLKNSAMRGHSLKKSFAALKPVFRKRNFKCHEGRHHG